MGLPKTVLSKHGAGGAAVDWNQGFHSVQYSTPYTQALAVRTFRLCSRQEDHQLQENLAVYFTLLEKMARKENDVIQ